MQKQALAILLTALCLAACYATTIAGMVDQWWNDPDMGHGFLVPMVVLWIVWRERAKWQSLPLAPSMWGVVVLLGAAALHTAGSLGVGLFASSVALLLSIAGAILCLGGTRLLRAWAFPLLLTIFMLPKLAIVYNQATLPLQLTASRLAAGMLTASGIGVIRDGNILDVRGHQVAVAEACSGIRFLLPLGFMAVVFAYVADPKPQPKPWMRVAVLAAAVPVAILANAIRVAASAWIPALDAGTAHEVTGWLVFTFSAVSLLMAQRLFSFLYGRSQS
jgi:exosortase